MPYTDPLFGIVIFITIIAVAAFIDFLRNRYRNKKKEESFKNLTRSYEIMGYADGVKEFLKLSENPLPTLEFIAHSYIQSGNVQEAIKIYLGILDSLHNPKDKIEILQSLGIAYYMAGFLQRAKNIFLEILKNYPRNPQVLMHLLKTYEHLSEYKNAIDALECIEEIYDVQKVSDFSRPSPAFVSLSISEQKRFENLLLLNKFYLSTLLLINDHILPLSSKIQRLDEMKAKQPKLTKIILTYFKSVSHSLFWEQANTLNQEQVNNMIDILWDFERKDVPIEQITHPQILDVYRAKGWICDEKACEIFELDNMRILQRYCKFQTTLNFEYRCHSCNNIFPFDNPRCPHCGELLCNDLICKVQKVDYETSYSLL